MERAPVSLQRLEYREDGTVLYRGKFNPSLGTDHRLTSGLEFLAMLVPHIALRYECRIRCYGAVSTTIRLKLGWMKEDEGSAPEDVVVVPLVDKAALYPLADAASTLVFVFANDIASGRRAPEALLQRLAPF